MHLCKCLIFTDVVLEYLPTQKTWLSSENMKKYHFMSLPLQTYCHICLSNSLLLLVTVLISPPISLSVYVSVCLSLLCLTVTNLSSLLNSLRDLPENATSLLLGSLLHIEGVALNRVCEGESESAPVYSKSFPFCCSNC